MTDRKDITAQNKKTYDALASEYEARADKRSKGNLGRVEYFSQFITTGKKVLDVGCAVGLDVLHFTHLGFEASGIELSPNMVAFARKRNPTARIIEGDFLALHLDEKFDAIFTRAFIHLFPKAVGIEIMVKIQDLLKDGGVAFLGVSVADQPREGWLPKDDYAVAPARYKKFWTEQELREALVSVGFEVLDVIRPVDTEGKKRVAFTVKKPKRTVATSRSSDD